MKPGLLRELRPHKAALLSLTTVFVLTRVLGFAAGLRYLVGEDIWLMNVMDLDILHHHLFRALFHLHAQPPLFNLLIGVAEKLAGPGFGGLMLGLNLVLGLVACLAAYLALVHFGLPRSWSLCVSLFLALNPDALLYEFDPTYTILIYALLALAALALALYLRNKTAQSLYCFALLCVLLTLSRSIFQWIWIVPIFAVLWLLLPSERKRILQVGLLTIFVSLLWPAKNYLLFHQFTSTTWGPYSMSKHWVYGDPSPAEQAWIAQGKLPTLRRPLGGAESDPKVMEQFAKEYPVAPTGYPELDSISKNNNATVNWNSLAVLSMHQAEARDLRFLLVHDWRHYLRSLRFGFRDYFSPASDYFIAYSGRLDSNAQYQRIAVADRLARRLCCQPFGFSQASTGELFPPGTPPIAIFFDRVKRECLGSYLAFLILLVAAALALLKSSFWIDGAQRRIAVLVLSWTVLLNAVTSVLIEFMESMRYRFEIQSILLIAIALFAWQLRVFLRSRRQAHAI